MLPYMPDDESPEILGTASTVFPDAEELLSAGNRDLFAMDTAEEDLELDDYTDDAELVPNTPEQSQNAKRLRAKFGAKFGKVTGTPEHILKAKAAEKLKEARRRYIRDKFNLSGRFGKDG